VEASTDELYSQGSAGTLRDEFDSPERAVEVVVMWGDESVLHVEHLSPPRTFCVGEALDSKGRLATDFLIGRESLGAERVPVLLSQDGLAQVVVPAGGNLEVAMGDSSFALAELEAEGLLSPCSELAGARQCRLADGTSARVQYAGFTFVARPLPAARRIGFAGPRRFSLRDQGWMLASLLAHVSLLALFYFSPPRSSALSVHDLSTESRLIEFMREARSADDPPLPDFLDPAKTDAKDGKSGERHEGDEGAMGKPDHEKTNKRYAVKGPPDNADPHLARDAAKELAANAGIIGVLRQLSGAWQSPTSPYGRNEALGNDPESALGALLGPQIGANGGIGGLGMLGTGRGGGGDAHDTIGVGKVGTLGGLGYAHAAGSLAGRHAKVPPTLRSGPVDIRGGLSKEVIRRVVHRHLAEVRHCYEQQLIERPDLQGRVSVKFIIAPSGEVRASVLAASTLGHPRVEQCVVDAVARWTFPQPEGGGMVVVTYPFVLQQVGD